MSISIYDYDDYRTYLKALIHRNRPIRGFQAQLAKAAPCQSSYLSQVLHSSVQLNPDQAHGIAAYLSLDDFETEYFINLVNLDRASSSRYKMFIQKKLKELKSRGKDYSHRASSSQLPVNSESLFYYSAWHWLALHMIVGIPRFQTVKAISDRLKLPTSFVENGLRQLENLRLVEWKGDRWVRTQNNVHLPKKSPFVAVHHNNWRLRAAMSAAEASDDSFHYSVVYTLSLRDFEMIKSRLQDFIVETRNQVDHSDDQEIVSINLDCFRL